VTLIHVDIFKFLDGQTEGDDVQLPSTNHPNPEHEKQPAYPKKPPTSYNFYIKDKRDKIVRNNPGLNSVILYYPIFLSIF